MSTSCVNPSKYVVLDVETNGLSSINDDLLSITIYKPDTDELYDRFLPLELDSRVYTTKYNGITAKDLEGLLPLSQEEVDQLIIDFELKQRIILTYGGLDAKFMEKYFQRHELKGIEYFAFYNFKHEIISSRFSEGNITKDNLCTLFGIENVNSVHSGKNDCILEWKLYEKMNGNRILITDNKVFEFNNEYYVPASFLSSYPNLRYYIPYLPKITCESKEVFSLPVPYYRRGGYTGDINGMVIEHLINSLLNVRKMQSKSVLLKNKRKLKYLGELPSKVDTIPIIFNRDGSVTAVRSQDKRLENDLNKSIDVLKKVFKPLIDFIGNDIFKGQVINSQELVINHDRKILALCDLSNNDSILEIKTSRFESIEKYAEQLYYEANGRKSFILKEDWSFSIGVVYKIFEVKFNVKEFVDPIQARLIKAKSIIESDTVELLSYIDSKSPIKLKCKICGNEWFSSYHMAKKRRNCPSCFPVITEKKRLTKEKKPNTQNPKRIAPILSEEEKAIKDKQRLDNKIQKYKKKLEDRSNNELIVLSYNGANKLAKAKCAKCGFEWQRRADHLLEKPYCPVCNKCKKNIL